MKVRCDSACIVTAMEINKTLEMSCVGLTRYLLSGMANFPALESLDKIVGKIDKIQQKSSLGHVPSSLRSFFLAARFLLFLPAERCATTSQSSQTATRRRKKETVRVAMS